MKRKKIVMCLCWHRMVSTYIIYIYIYIHIHIYIYIYIYICVEGGRERNEFHFLRVVEEVYVKIFRFVNLLICKLCSSE